MHAADLASFEPRPLAVGIGYEEQRVATIHPTEYDLPMDLIVTEANIYRRVGGHTVPISTGECASAMGELLRRRGLPRPQANLER